VTLKTVESNDAEYSADITGINYNFKYIQKEKELFYIVIIYI